MAKPDGRIEKGQRLGSAISARAWNRAQDAADIVLGVRPGVEAGIAAYQEPHRVIVTMKKRTSSQAMYPGHAVLFYLNTEQDTIAARTRKLVVPSWPATASTFADALSSIDSQPITDAAKRLAKENYASHISKTTPLYSCELSTPVSSLQGSATAVEDFFPPIGAVVEESKPGDTAARVCISGPALMFVRYLFSYQWQMANVCAVRSRTLANISAPYNNAVGCLDAHRGGNIRVFSSESDPQQPPSFPAIVLVPVML